jgi:hypothetical protein
MHDAPPARADDALETVITIGWNAQADAARFGRMGE